MFWRERGLARVKICQLYSNSRAIGAANELTNHTVLPAIDTLKMGDLYPYKMDILWRSEQLKPTDKYFKVSDLVLWEVGYHNYTMIYFI